MATVTGKIEVAPYRATLQVVPETDPIAPLIFYADEPKHQGGGDTAPSPSKLVLGGLAACKLITMRMYANRKEWPVEAIEISLKMTPDITKSPAETEIVADIVVHGPLDAEQIERLKDIAAKCPVHKMLSGTITIR